MIRILPRLQTTSASVAVLREMPNMTRGQDKADSIGRRVGWLAWPGASSACPYSVLGTFEGVGRARHVLAVDDGDGV